MMKMKRAALQLMIAILTFLIGISTDIAVNKAIDYLPPSEIGYEPLNDLQLPPQSITTIHWSDLEPLELLRIKTGLTKSTEEQMKQDALHKSKARRRN